MLYLSFSSDDFTWHILLCTDLLIAAAQPLYLQSSEVMKYHELGTYDTLYHDPVLIFIVFCPSFTKDSICTIMLLLRCRPVTPIYEKWIIIRHYELSIVPGLIFAMFVHSHTSAAISVNCSTTAHHTFGVKDKHVELALWCNIIIPSAHLLHLHSSRQSGPR